MKTIILSFVLTVSIVLSGTLYAQTKEQKQEPTKTEQKNDVKVQTAPQSTQTPQTQPNAQSKPAAPKSTPADRAKMATDRISAKVPDLTADQKTKLTAVHLDAYTQMDKDRTAYKDDQEKLKASSKANSDKLKEGVKGILTPEQYKLYTTPPPKPEGQTTPPKQDVAKPKPVEQTKPATEVKNK